MSALVDQIKALLRDAVTFTDKASGIQLRAYQVAVVRAIVESVVYHRGLSIVVIFPRQSGKNEVQAQIETYLLTLLSELDAEMIKVSPTWKPQSLNAMRRLERVLSRNVITRGLWAKERGYIYRINRARIFFLSGSPEANIVGATASTLLSVDESQDIEIGKYDKDLAPMAASTNATRVFWGTAWTSRTLLARELRAAKLAQERDGQRRVFVLTADDVAAEVPAYGEFVKEQVQKLGRSHPLVRTQFFSEEIDAEGGMFPAARVGLMKGDHRAGACPEAGKVYALLLDVAGEDEGANAGAFADGSSTSGGTAGLSNDRRDSTALTVVEVDLSTVEDPLLRAPTYRVVQRRAWVGVKHARIYGEVRALAQSWGARYVVVDGTGVGAGLVSFLDKALPGRVLPFIFNQSTKSSLGWSFLGVVDTGRFKDFKHGDSSEAYDLQALFFEQLSFMQYEILPGPAKVMRWSVPDGTRNPATGELVHDDLVLSAALCGVLDDQEWTISGPALVVRRSDPLKEMDHGF
ncbi:MAG: hypothetical protein GYA36_20410 [Veillonellaceae bacterium]|nr:hypothetical protein [Veillonellaceae bacterium]